MDIRFKTGHEPEVKFFKNERSAAEKVIDLLKDYGEQMRSQLHADLSGELTEACFDMGLLTHEQLMDDKVP